MSGVKVTNEGPVRPTPDPQSVTGTTSGDNVDWEPGTTSEIPPGVDPGDVLTWDGDSWEPEPVSVVIPAGTYLTAIEGEQAVIKAHGSMGSTETFDPTDGNIHTGTLDAGCTFTLSAPSGTGACELELVLTQDGTGGHAITWPGSVTVVGTYDTTAGTTSTIILRSLDGGTSWVAYVVGGTGVSFAAPTGGYGSAAAGSASTALRSDAVFPKPTESDLSTSDVTTGNVTSTKHGFAPKAPADATKFLNGAATPAYAQVKDSDLSTSDVTSNDVSTTKHGFAPKAPNDATKYLDGTGAYSVPPGGSSHYLTIASSHSTPLVFDDIVQSSAGDDFIYSS